MKTLRAMAAVWFRLLIDLRRNYGLGFPYLIFPALSLLTLALPPQAERATAVAGLFGMHVVLGNMGLSSVISEEKRTGTLYFLRCAGVSCGGYCAASVLFAEAMTFMCSLPFVATMGTGLFARTWAAAAFVVACAALLGVAIGLGAKNQTTVGPLSTIASLVVGLGPALLHRGISDGRGRWIFTYETSSIALGLQRTASVQGFLVSLVTGILLGLACWAAFRRIRAVEL